MKQIRIRTFAAALAVVFTAGVVLCMSGSDPYLNYDMVNSSLDLPLKAHSSR